MMTSCNKVSWYCAPEILSRVVSSRIEPVAHSGNTAFDYLYCIWLQRMIGVRSSNYSILFLLNRRNRIVMIWGQITCNTYPRLFTHTSSLKATWHVLESACVQCWYSQSKHIVHCAHMTSTGEWTTTQGRAVCCIWLWKANRRLSKRHCWGQMGLSSLSDLILQWSKLTSEIFVSKKKNVFNLIAFTIVQ